LERDLAVDGQGSHLLIFPGLWVGLELSLSEIGQGLNGMTAALHAKITKVRRPAPRNSADMAWEREKSWPVVYLRIPERRICRLCLENWSVWLWNRFDKGGQKRWYYSEIQSLLCCQILDIFKWVKNRRQEP